MYKNLSNRIQFLFVLVFIILTSSVALSQEEKEDNPATWRYFKILANADDDSVFLNLQDDLNIDPKLGSYTIIVNILDPNPANHYIVIGDETDPSALRFSWAQLKKENQARLLSWTGPNKENLNKKKYNYASVFTEGIKRIKFKDIIAPPKREREILSTTAYINPYLNLFGGEPLGIPLKKSFGFSFYTGTPYSGPLETDMIGANFHLLGASVGITTRFYELVFKRWGEVGADAFASYNNIFAPHLGLRASYVIPFGNFFEISYFTVLDSGKEGSNKPNLVTNYASTDTSKKYMPNMYLKSGGYLNFEFRYPLRTLGSTRAKIYIAKFLDEYHIGYVGRELRVAGSVFDLRMDYKFPVSDQRNWQFLFEVYISNISESFGLNAFAIGPSIRLTKNPDGNFGIVTALVNARFKLGDFYDEK